MQSPDAKRNSCTVRQSTPVKLAVIFKLDIDRTPLSSERMHTRSRLVKRVWYTRKSGATPAIDCQVRRTGAAISKRQAQHKRNNCTVRQSH